MGTVEITKITDEIFGNCIRMTNGIVELLVTTDFGPRVIHFSLVGKENMFYQDKEKATLGDKHDAYDGEIMKLYGGHRIWISPEILPRCYYPDNSPVECIAIENGMSFVSPVEKFNNIQKTMTITLSEDSSNVIVDHTIKNCGAWDLELAIWCITMTDINGKEIIPLINRPSGLLANRNITLWDYTAMNDSRVYWGKDFITLTQNPEISQPFKLGLNNESGWAAIYNKGQVFFKFFEPKLGGFYPDNGCSYETYTNNVMMEAETLDEFVQLPPNESTTHTEEWELYEETEVPTNDEADIRRIVSKHISL